MHITDEMMAAEQEKWEVPVNQELDQLITNMMAQHMADELNKLPQQFPYMTNVKRETLQILQGKVLTFQNQHGIKLYEFIIEMCSIFFGANCECKFKKCTDYEGHEVNQMVIDIFITSRDVVFRKLIDMGIRREQPGDRD